MLVLAALGGAAVAQRNSSPARPMSDAAPPVARPAPARARGVMEPPPASLPDGPGREIAERACMICHSAMLITQQHKDSTGWEKTVSLMEKWGAPVEPAARESLMAYLRTSFPPTDTSRAK